MTDGQNPPTKEPSLEAVYARVRRKVFRMVGYRQDHEDIVQLAMEAFVKSRENFRGEGSLLGFADAITANVARTYMYKQHRTILVREMVAERQEWPEIEEGPADEAEKMDMLRRLLEILERLKPKYRMACVLYYLEGKPVAEIASIEKKSENAIRLRILRGRREIRKRASKDPVLAEWLEEIGEAR